MRPPMFTQIALYQPRNGTPSWPGDPPPAADDAGAAAAPPPVEPAQNAGNTTVVVNNAPAGNGFLSQEACQEANTNAFISAGGYAFGASFVGIVIFLVMRKKLWLSSFGRYLTAVLTASLVAGVLAGWDPVRADLLQQCIQSSDFHQYVFLGGQLFARALVLGLIPAFVVTFLGCFVANRT